MMELREKVAWEILAVFAIYEPGATASPLDAADRILAIPEIAEALRVKAVCDEAVRKALSAD